MKKRNSLVTFESALIIGLVSLIIEKIILRSPAMLLVKIIFIMLLFAGMFGVVFSWFEPIARKQLSQWSKGKTKVTRILNHCIILVVIMMLYALFYFNLGWFSLASLV